MVKGVVHCRMKGSEISVSHNCDHHAEHGKGIIASKGSKPFQDDLCYKASYACHDIKDPFSLN